MAIKNLLSAKIHEMRKKDNKQNDNLTRNAKQTEEEIGLTPLLGAPAVMSTNPFLVNFNRGSDDGLKSLYSFFWATFGVNPSGFSYGVTLNHLDANGGSIVNYTAAYNLTL